MAQNISLLGANYSSVPAVLLPKQGGGNARFDDCSVVTATASDVASGKIFVDSNGSITTGTNSGGGGGIGTLLATKSLGTISTSSTSSSDTGQSITIPNAADYDLIIVEVSVDTRVNNRHLANASLVYMTASSNISTKNGVTALTRELIFKLTSQGVAQSRYSGTAYGVYARVSTTTITDGAITLPIATRYNSTYSGTINGSYTARAYGVKLYDLIGG